MNSTNWLRLIIPCILLLALVGCESEAPIPTLAQFPTTAPTMAIPPLATAIASSVPTPTWTVSPTITPSATITDTPRAVRFAPMTPTPGVVIRISLTPSMTVPPTATFTPLPSAFIFGQSAQGRDLNAYRYGTGRHVVMLVGGVHTGFEANTVQLMQELRTHFNSNAGDILPEVTLLIVPALNPDGLTYGRELRGRFNGNNVDLNRNWGCDWSADAQFRNGAVNPGTQPFSEPETTALGSLIQRAQPAAVLFYHSAANGIFAGNCENSTGISSELAAVYGEASGYPYGEEFSAYEVSGTAPEWVDSLGIAAVDVELASATGTEFNRNLRAVLAVQRWVTQR